jgi:hypothetical protein
MSDESVPPPAPDKPVPPEGMSRSAWARELHRYGERDTKEIARKVGLSVPAVYAALRTREAYRPGQYDEPGAPTIAEFRQAEEIATARLSVSDRAEAIAKAIARARQARK